MASKKGWPQRLADRFEAVGWEVKLGAGCHFKARRPDGQSMSWPQSPSGTRSKDNKEAEARRFGLHEAEEKLARQRETERQARIERDREENGVPETRFIAPEPSPEKEDANVTKYGFIEVEGVKLGIAEVAKPVMHQHPRGGEPYALPHCRELLLVDDSIRYQCLKLTHSDPGHPDKVCARHFKTSGGLVVHWARGHKPDGTEKPELRDLGGVLPVEPRPGPTKEEIVADRVPASIYTMPDPRKAADFEPKVDDLAVPTGLMAQAVFQVERLRRLEQTLDSLAADAGSIAGSLEAVIEKLPDELVSPELLEKAEKFDRMIEAANQ